MKFFNESRTGNIKIGIGIKKKLFSQKNKFHKIEVFETNDFGKMLALNGEIQFCEMSEPIINEMVSHLSIFSHPNPKRILILGGGDGGILREIVRHSRLEEIFVVEQDRKITEASKKHFPKLDFRSSEKDSRVKIVFGDEREFMERFQDYFDIIIFNSTNQSLLDEGFYKSAYESLGREGLLMIKIGGFTEKLEMIRNCYKDVKRIFSQTKIHHFDYNFSDFSLVLASKKLSIKEMTHTTVRRRVKQFRGAGRLQYYTSDIHISSSILPRFYQEKLK